MTTDEQSTHFRYFTAFQKGEISIDTAACALTTDAVHQLNHATVDTERQERWDGPKPYLVRENEWNRSFLSPGTIDNEQAAFVARLDEQKV